MQRIITLIKTNTSYWLIILSLQSQVVVADPSENNLWQLWAKPRICVTPSNELFCKMDTDFQWAGVEQADICLLSSQEDVLLHCWPQAFGGQLLQEIISDKEITYWLSRPNDDEVLVKTIVRIVTIPQRPVRKRRRHVWSLL